jgi:dUTP pyrophosphatase
MVEVAVRVQLLIGCEDIKLPSYLTPGSSGADVGAAVQNPVEILPGAIVQIPLGFRIEIPWGFEAQIRPRSGLALDHGITILNAPATIDSDYRGPVMALVINLGRTSFTVRRGVRIAQLVIAPIAKGRFTLSDSLSSTERGEKGLGSSGVEAD